MDSNPGQQSGKSEADKRATLPTQLAQVLMAYVAVNKFLM